MRRWGGIALFVLGMMGLGHAQEARLGRYQVVYQGNHYTIEQRASSLVYRGENFSQTIQIRACNRDAIADFVETFEYKKQSAIPFEGEIAGPRILYFKEGAKTIAVSPTSDFGAWLRKVPMKMIGLNAVSELQCGRKH